MEDRVVSNDWPIIGYLTEHHLLRIDFSLSWAAIGLSDIFIQSSVNPWRGVAIVFLSHCEPVTRNGATLGSRDNVYWRFCFQFSQ